MTTQRIVVGSYEEFIVCYDLEEEEEQKEGEEAEERKEKKYKLTLSFTDHPHSSSVRCIAASQNGLVASGSADETIHVYNANAGRDVGTLMSHSGAVTALQFQGSKYLLSASEDATVVIWKTRTWEPLKTLRGHKGPLESLAVHPSGKLALSTGKDKLLKTWNLIKGRSAYVTNVKREGNLVRFSPSGNSYALVSGASLLQFYDVASASISFQLESPQRINALRYLDGDAEDDLVAFGGEGSSVKIVSVSRKTVVGEFEAHEKRIRDLCVLEPEDESEKESTESSSATVRLLATASNDGLVKVWRLEVTADRSGVNSRLLCQADAGLRISCICSYGRKASSSEKRRSEEGEVEGETSEKPTVEEEEMDRDSKRVKLQ